MCVCVCVCVRVWGKGGGYAVVFNVMHYWDVSAGTLNPVC